MHTFAGTERGLLAVDGGSELLSGRPVIASSGSWALLDGNALASLRGGLETKLEGPPAWCLLEAGEQLYVGTAEARLYGGPSATGELAIVESFDQIDTRDEWYTPWGAPPDTRSLAVTAGGALLVNVHVGGVWRHAGSDAGPSGDSQSWTEVVKVDADTHQVVADATRDVAVAAAAVGFGRSLDGGTTWDWTAEGLHGSYCRAVAIAGDTVLLSASTGPGSGRGAVYRRALHSDGPFEKSHTGLPEWFPFNVNTGQLTAAGDEVVLGTDDGRVFRSPDAGSTWEPVAEGLPVIRFVVTD
jgi:hypothetical protein